MMLVRRSEPHCQMNSEIRRVMSTATNSSLKQSCSAFASVTSALEVNLNVMRSINSRFTYLLTYLLTYYHAVIHRHCLIYVHCVQKKVTPWKMYNKKCHIRTNPNKIS